MAEDYSNCEDWTGYEPTEEERQRVEENLRLYGEHFAEQAGDA